jgi:quinol monooxygenase YgiN
MSNQRILMSLTIAVRIGNALRFGGVFVMASTVHVVARFVAKLGREAELHEVLAGLVAPTRRELGCHQYDLLANPANPRDCCFVERWDGDEALDRHLETAHVRMALERSSEMIEAPPDVRRYRLL